MLPTLNALRAFEAAARHGGFIAAAEELHVTRGAISRHIKLLEAQLGVDLFHRNHRGVVLTEAGRQLLPELTSAFSQIARAADRVSSMAPELRIICPPALSIRWLFPRLDAFRALHPDVRVRLTTDFYSDKGFDPAQYDIGVSLEHWPGRSDDIVTQPLFPMHFTPACAPSLLERGPALKSPTDFRHHTLLHESAKREDWAAWLKKFEVADVDATAGEVFPNLDMAVRAAVMGAGVVMADLHLCADEIENGALVCPFPEMVSDTPFGAYALIGPQSIWDEPRVRAFREWAADA